MVTALLRQIQQVDLHGGNSVAEAAEVMQRILAGKGSEAQTNAVLANAGVAIATAKKISIVDGIAAANDALSSGSAMKSLKQFIQVNS